MQCSLRTLVYIYLFGGVTFIPLVLLAVVAFVYYTSPVVLPDSPQQPAIVPEKAAADEPNSTAVEEHKDEDELEGVDAHKVGWLQVSREYDSKIGLVGPEKIPGNHRGKYMDKMRSLLDRQETLSPNTSGFLKVKAAMFYAVLKHGNLFLYETEEHLDVKHVVVLQHFVISLWPIHDDDDTLFLKPNAICLSRKTSDNGSVDPTRDNDPQLNPTEPPKKPKPPENSYFLFPTTNIEKEDWYFALLRGAKATTGSTKSPSPSEPAIAAIPARFDQSHMISLIQSLHSTDAHLQTRWLNALVGRVFLGIYKTRWMEEWCIKKITKKIARVNRPAFLSDIKVEKVVVGSQPPIFTHPRLKELSASGEFAADVNVAYNGGFRVQISTVATLQLGSRFKPRQVTLSMAVTVKKLEGKLMLRIKKPPTNRLWVGFYETPVMDLTIEPIVSSRQITYTMVLRAIESRIREAVEESIVLPNMDDTAFLPTNGEFYRGGIWERRDDEPLIESTDPAARGDVEGVEKELEDVIKSEIAKNISTENGESADSVEQLEPKKRLRTTLRSPAKEISTPKVLSDQNLRGRVGRSQSFTSVASAPAIVATEIVNVAGTSPSRDKEDWAAEAAARAIARRAGINDSPKSTMDIPRGSGPPSVRSESSEEAIRGDQEKDQRDSEIPPLLPSDRSSSAPPTSPTGNSQPRDGQPTTESNHAKRFPTFAMDKDATLSKRVSEATGVAREMLKTRLNTYLAKRQQAKLEKHLLSKDRDLLVNSVKPRTRLPSDSLPDLQLPKPEDDDVDSGPLPFENKKSPTFLSGEISSFPSPGYGPSAMMRIPSTMANARTPASEPASPIPSDVVPSTTAVPPKSEVSPSMTLYFPTPTAPRPIPRRPVPTSSHLSRSVEVDSGTQTSSSSVESKDVVPTPEEDSDLMILHIPSDNEDVESRTSSSKDMGSPSESPPEPRKVLLDTEEAVLELSSYGSSKSLRASVAHEASRQWNEKDVSDNRDMPELMEEGLMG